MKRKLVMVLTVCAMAVMVTACGKKSANTETTAAAGVTEASQDASAGAASNGAESKDGSSAAAEKETTTAEETTVDPKEAAGPGAVSDGEVEVADQENKNYEDLESSDYEGFAKQVVDAVANKDMNALADLIAYPAYVSCVKENDGIVNSKEEFLAQDKEVIFDQSILDAMSKADLSDLTPLMTGVVIGDDTPNIIFNSVDGALGITGINY